MRALSGPCEESAGGRCRCDTGGSEPGRQDGDRVFDARHRRAGAGRCGDRGRLQGGLRPEDKSVFHGAGGIRIPAYVKILIYFCKMCIGKNGILRQLVRWCEMACIM